MKKIKPLLPSLKEKKRYLVFEVISDKIISQKLINDSIEKNTEYFLGDLDKARSGLIIIKERFNKSNQRGIIRVNNKYVDKLKFSLALIKRISNKNAIIKSVGVSGILKKAFNKYIAN
jgi:ribonuclease P/MRP protein subunit POP5